MKKYIVIALMALSTISCSDLLEQQNPSYVTAEGAWDSLSDTESGVYATYAALRNDAILNIRYEGFRCDLSYPGYGRPIATGNQTGLTWYNQEYVNSTTGIDKKWNATYTAIWRANQVIEALERIAPTIEYGSEDYEAYGIQMGHMKFIRGLMYFYLHSSYNNGSVVLRTKAVSSPDEFAQELAPAADVLKFFRADLQEAYNLLPERSEQSSRFQNLASKGAAAVALATSYLYEKEYDAAITLFEEVIESGEYELETDMKNLFTTAGEHNCESIFEITYSTDYRKDLSSGDANAMSNALNTRMTSSTTAPLPAAWLVYEYSHEKVDPKNPVNTEDRLLNNNGISWRASRSVALAQDVRTPYYLTDNAAMNCAMGGAATKPTPNGGFGKLKKFSNDDLFPEKEKTPGVSGKNVTVSRLADVYLMYAEAKLMRDGDVATALKYINKIRERWGLVLLGGSNGDTTRTYDEVAYDATTLMNQIMYYERPLELSYEGHQIRWQDLRRWGLLEDDSHNIFRQRATEVYYAHDFKAAYLNEPNKFKKKYNVAITNSLDYANANAVSAHTIDYEFKISATQYTKKDNQYLPIPLTEITANSAIK